MVDVVTAEKRSEMMRGIKGSNTRPEMIIRKGIHALGFRYKLHDKNVPGKPDLVFPKFNAVVFIHGCFWHQHDCHLFKWPQSRPEFWKTKITGNVTRDAVVRTELKNKGWRVLIIWECALKGKQKQPFDNVLEQTVKWLESSNKTAEISGNKVKQHD